MNEKSLNERYQRQMLLKEFGMPAQQKLLQAKVLVIGAGGLGCPALQYLAAAGVGTIGIADHDVVDISNLHRQVLYTMEDVGKPKALMAASKLKAMNPGIQIKEMNLRITRENALDIIAEFDLVIDGSDNFPTRYLVNDACVLTGKPLVYGSVFRFEGQVGVFNLEYENVITNYRDFFPLPPASSADFSCMETGVLGAVPGIIGTLQALEAIKIITGVGRPLANRIQTFNSLRNVWYEVQIQPNPVVNGTIPLTMEEFKHMNYENFCGMKNHGIREISIVEFSEYLHRDDVLIVDVREIGEQPVLNEFPHQRIPLSELSNNMGKIGMQKEIVTFCQTGVRSIKAAAIISKELNHLNVYSLKGGITAWKRTRELQQEKK